MPRLGDVVCSRDGELDFRLKGEVNKDKPLLKLWITGWLTLMCQRCLGTIDYPLDIYVNYVVVLSEEMLPLPNDENDELDYLVADERMHVAQLVEDEALLGLPLALMHEECSASLRGSTQKDSPFNALKGWKLKS